MRVAIGRHIRERRDILVTTVTASKTRSNRSLTASRYFIGGCEQGLKLQCQRTSKYALQANKISSQQAPSKAALFNEPFFQAGQRTTRGWWDWRNDQMTSCAVSSTCLHFVRIAMVASHHGFRRLGICDTETTKRMATCGNTLTHFRLSLSRLLLSSFRRIEPGTFRECMAISVPPSCKTPAPKDTASVTIIKKKEGHSGEGGQVAEAWNISSNTVLFESHVLREALDYSFLQQSKSQPDSLAFVPLIACITPILQMASVNRAIKILSFGQCPPLTEVQR